MHNISCYSLMYWCDFSSDITKDKAERFLNRISVVYSNIDGEFKHGNKIGEYTVAPLD